MQNPEIILYEANKYVVRFVHHRWTVLMYVQDIYCRKMKREGILDNNIVFFSTRKEAEQEIKNVIIPYLLKEKGVPLDQIIGW